MIILYTQNVWILLDPSEMAGTGLKLSTDYRGWTIRNLYIVTLTLSNFHSLRSVN